MKLLNFIIIKITTCLILGICIAHYFQFDFQVSFYITVGLILALAVNWFFLRNTISRKPYFAILCYLSVIGIGINAYNIQNEKLQPRHYTHFFNDDSLVQIELKVLKRLKSDAYNDKYIVTVNSINDKKVTGKLLINIRKDSLTNVLPVDAVLFCSTQLKVIQKPLNPYQFDYSKYLELKQVYNQVYLDGSNIFLKPERKATIYGFADQLRTHINKKLIAAGFKDDTLSIINALLLGQRQTIDKSIYNNYVNSGTIHILAVSGLHVGILLLILNFILRPLLLFKQWRILRPLIIVLLLWSFAVIAGLTPSVTRAVGMFSIISIAMHLKRPTNIYNTLAISAFFILLFKPLFLFEVGFQMSYLAVLGIVSIQPLLYKFWQPKYWIIDKPWQIFTVTIAAQFGVVPISLFYFHQFPGLFFISNLVVIPFLGIILGLGLIVILLVIIGHIPSPVVELYSFIIESLNWFIAWIAQFEDFLLRDIPFTLLQVIVTYMIIIALVQTYKLKTFKWATICIAGIISFQTILFYNKLQNQNDAFIIFNKSRYTIIGQKSKQQLLIHHNLDSIKLSTDNVIKNYKVRSLLSKEKYDSLQHIYQFKSARILVVDSLGVYKNLSFEPDIILLRNSPSINLNRLIDSLKPEQIIADASNYKTYVNRWKVTCIKKQLPFHYTNEKGAFIMSQ